MIRIWKILCCALIILALAGCAKPADNPEILPSLQPQPSPTSPPTETSTAVPTFTAVLTPADSVDFSTQILADFPLSVGATWEYSAEIDYMDRANPPGLIKWTGVITDTVLDRQVSPEGNLIFIVQEEMQPLPPAEVWRQPGAFEYILSGDGVYKYGLKIYQWPLTNKTSWKAFADFDYEIAAQPLREIEIPLGNLDHCFELTLVTNPDTTIDTFCPGIGIVKHTYWHHGEPQIENFLLTAYTPGQ